MDSPNLDNDLHFQNELTERIKLKYQKNGPGKDLSFMPYKKRILIHFFEDQFRSALSISDSSANKSLTIVNDDKLSNQLTGIPNQRQKKIKKCPHVWQFCADILDDANYNPAIVKWLSQEKGIFKIVKPDQVAELWGAQKNRRSDKKMNYEKMARGMRYSRREGFFKKLDKDKPNEYGKQLVFQFSDKVVKNIGWKWSFSK